MARKPVPSTLKDLKHKSGKNLRVGDFQRDYLNVVAEKKFPAVYEQMSATQQQEANAMLDVLMPLSNPKFLKKRLDEEQHKAYAKAFPVQTPTQKTGKSRYSVSALMEKITMRTHKNTEAANAKQTELRKAFEDFHLSYATKYELVKALARTISTTGRDRPKFDDQIKGLIEGYGKLLAAQQGHNNGHMDDLTGLYVPENGVPLDIDHRVSLKDMTNAFYGFILEKALSSLKDTNAQEPFTPDQINDAIAYGYKRLADNVSIPKVGEGEDKIPSVGMMPRAANLHKSDDDWREYLTKILPSEAPLSKDDKRPYGKMIETLKSYLPHPDKFTDMEVEALRSYISVAHRSGLRLGQLPVGSVNMFNAFAEDVATALAVYEQKHSRQCNSYAKLADDINKRSLQGSQMTDTQKKRHAALSKHFHEYITPIMKDLCAKYNIVPEHPLIPIHPATKHVPNPQEVMEYMLDANTLFPSQAGMVPTIMGHKGHITKKKQITSELDKQLGRALDMWLGPVNLGDGAGAQYLKNIMVQILRQHVLQHMRKEEFNSIHVDKDGRPAFRLQTKEDINKMLPGDDDKPITKIGMAIPHKTSAIDMVQKVLGEALEQHPKLLEQQAPPTLAVISSLEEWDKNNLQKKKKKEYLKAVEKVKARLGEEQDSMQLHGYRSVV